MKKMTFTGLLTIIFFFLSIFPVYAVVGDIDGSGTVDGNDLALFSLTFGANRNSPKWSATADFVDNGLVDGEDLSSFAPNFGTSGVGAVAARVIWIESETHGKRLAKTVSGPEKASNKIGDIEQVQINISGSNMNTVSEQFPFADKKGLLAKVSAGSNRTLTISGLNASGAAIFRGVTTIIVFENATTNVSLYATEVKLASKRSPLLTAGDDQSYALTSDGVLWGWGLNMYGQLGDGTKIDAPMPVRTSQLSELIGIINVDAGFDNVAALKYDGTVWSWGYNDFGQLGNGKIGDKFDNLTSLAETETSPVPVMANSTTLFDNVTAVSAGGYHVLAVKTDGTIWSWGHNSDGQLGVSGSITPNSEWPIEITITSVKTVSAGAFHSTALKNDGTLWTWGMNEQGQLGDSNAPTKDFNPFMVLSGVKSVAAGYFHTVALKNNSTVWAWGDREYGQVGDGTFGDRDPLSTTIPVDIVDSPVLVNINNVIAVAAGGHHSLALKSDGTVWAWGSNDFGQLGDGTFGDASDTTVSDNDFESMPVQVKGAGGIGFLTDIVAIEAGWRHSLAIEADGTVWAWGENEFGQLGDNNPGDGIYNPADKDISATPVQVLNINVN